MSKQVDWAQVCRAEASTTLDVNALCANSEAPGRSPIDDLIVYLGSVLPLGTPESLKSSDVLGRVLLLGLVSGTEMYFRTILARLIVLCPLCRKHASNQMVSLGAVDYYGHDDLGFGLLEGVSFATQGETLKYTKKLTGVEWSSETSVGTAISTFESLSHFRHAAVHARGELSHRNAGELGISATGRQCLVLDFGGVQHAADVCLNAARAYNRYMFTKLIERWIAKRVFTGAIKADQKQFAKLFALFRAREDSLGGRRYSRSVFEKLAPAIQKSITQKPNIS